MSRYSTGQVHSGTRVIIGIDFAVHSVILPDNEGSINLQIWDFGEEQHFRPLIPCFCQGAAGAILYFDLQDPGSLSQLEGWISLFRNHTENIPIVLCGTNCDDTKEVSNEIVYDFLLRHDLKGYFKISVETGCNIDESFELLSTLMVEQWPNSVINSTARISTFIPNQIRID